MLKSDMRLGKMQVWTTSVVTREGERWCKGNKAHIFVCMQSTYAFIGSDDILCNLNAQS